MVEGNGIQLWAGRIVSKDRNEVSEETGSSCGLEGHQRMQERGQLSSAADWKGS